MRYPFYRRLGGPQGRSGRAENLVPNGIRYRIAQPVVSHYNDWATRPTCVIICDSYSWSTTTQNSRRVIEINLFSVLFLLNVPPTPSSLIRDVLGCQLPVCNRLDYVTLKMKVLRSSETLGATRPKTQRCSSKTGNFTTMAEIISKLTSCIIVVDMSVGFGLTWSTWKYMGK